MAIPESPAPMMATLVVCTASDIVVGLVFGLDADVDVVDLDADVNAHKLAIVYGGATTKLIPQSVAEWRWKLSSLQRARRDMKSKENNIRPGPVRLRLGRNARPWKVDSHSISELRRWAMIGCGPDQGDKGPSF
jgi:hypothetical protein